MKPFIALLALCLLAATPAPGQARPGDGGADCVPASKTVYLDVSGFGRKHHAAKNLTESHREMAAAGWQFVDLEIYTENSDLQGFFITYTQTDCG